jgi:hypothetical protein
MDQLDIDMFLTAKRQLKIRHWFLYLCGALMVVSGGFAILGIGLPYSKSILWGSVFGALLVNSDWLSARSAYSRQRLLGIIQSQISRDPEALKYVASKLNQSEAA